MTSGNNAERSVTLICNEIKRIILKSRPHSLIRIDRPSMQEALWLSAASIPCPLILLNFNAPEIDRLHPLLNLAKFGNCAESSEVLEVRLTQHHSIRFPFLHSDFCKETFPIIT